MTNTLSKFAYTPTYFFPEENIEGVPALGFVFNHSLFEDVYEQIMMKVNSEAGISLAAEYLPQQREFIPLGQDLFGIEPFGYGRCITFSRDGDDVILKVLLVKPELVRHACLMVNLIVKTLESMSYDLVENKGCLELININTLIPRLGEVGFHRHSVGGRVHKPVIDWLLQVVESGDGECVLIGLVVQAMKLSFLKLSDFGSGEADDCGCLILGDGRFILQTYGNATDLSIYPEGVDYRGLKCSDSAEFSCHNLDTAYQQLVLLSGLFMICRLAQERLSSL